MGPIYTVSKVLENSRKLASITSPCPDYIQTSDLKRARIHEKVFTNISDQQFPPVHEYCHIMSHIVFVNTNRFTGA